MEFKIRDKVRRIQDNFNSTFGIGDTGIIIKINGNDAYVLTDKYNRLETSVSLSKLELIEEKKEEININKEEIIINKLLPIRTIFQYNENSKKGATILFWSDKKDDKTVIILSKDDKFNKEIGFLWAFYNKYSGYSRNKVNKIVSCVNKKSLKEFLKIFFKEYTSMNNDEIEKYLKNVCK